MQNTMSNKNDKKYRIRKTPRPKSHTKAKPKQNLVANPIFVITFEIIFAKLCDRKVTLKLKINQI